MKELNEYKVTLNDETKEIIISKDGKKFILSPKNRELSEDIYIANVDSEIFKKIVEILIETGWFSLQDKSQIRTEIKEGEVALVKGFRFRQDFLDFEHSNQEITKAIYESALRLSEDEMNILLFDVIEYYILLIDKMNMPFNIHLGKNRVSSFTKENFETDFYSSYIRLTTSLITFLCVSVKDYGYTYLEDKKIISVLRSLG